MLAGVGRSQDQRCSAVGYPCDCFTRGIYDLHVIDLKQIPLLEQSPADVMVRYSVKDIMREEAGPWINGGHGGHLAGRRECKEPQHAVESKAMTWGPLGRAVDGWSAGETVTSPLPIADSSPVVAAAFQGHYYGMFQDQPDEPLGSLVPFEAIAWPNIHSYPDIKSLRKKMNPADKDKYIDLRPYVNCNGYSILPQASMASAFMLFRRLGLRHLPVVDHDGDLCSLEAAESSLERTGEFSREVFVVAMATG
eukprot:Skav221480  [mRNA]  locus=scaffold1514:60594:63497:+ [translate_table: standard]